LFVLGKRDDDGSNNRGASSRTPFQFGRVQAAALDILQVIFLDGLINRVECGSQREQRRASLVGDGAKWRITNFKQVARAMSKWA